MGNNEALKIGDVVRLYSGGPMMTVVSAPDEPQVGCAWFDDDDRLQRDRFPLAAIARTDPNATRAG